MWVEIGAEKLSGTDYSDNEVRHEKMTITYTDGEEYAWRWVVVSHKYQPERIVSCHETRSDALESLITKKGKARRPSAKVENS